MVTSSRFKKWWLVSVRGYSIAVTTMTPHETLLGRVSYRHEWELIEPHTCDKTE
jgi:hypothetical protein